MAPVLRVFDVNGAPIRGFEEPKDWSMSYKLPGGCEAVNCRVEGVFDRRFIQQVSKAVFYAEISDPAADVIWSGKVDLLSFSQVVSTIRFQGWWYTLDDDIFGWDAVKYPSPTYPDAIIRDIVEKSGGYISRDFSGIKVNPVDVGAASGNSLAQFDTRTVLNVLVDFVQIGGIAGEQWYPAVWADKKMRYFPLSDTPKWRASWRDLDADWDFTVDPKTVYSSVLISYTDPDGVGQRYLGHDSSTQSDILGGKDRTYPFSLAGNFRLTQEMVVKIADRFLDDHKYPQQRGGSLSFKGNTVQPIDGGRAEQTYRVLPGDVIVIDDFPAPDDGWTGKPDGIRAFVVLQTTWDSQTGKLSFTPDQSGHDTAGILAKIMGQVPQSTK
jgi:hypothetical protein